ncbi:MAG: hypothetical protein LLG04_05385 [Parachlamydia sp.]|nr:hypothetical protein [Parachlamydia sp.]
MATEIIRAEPPRDIYANAAKESDKLMQYGRLYCKNIKVFVSNQYNLLKRHDKAFFPVALVAASVGMLFAGNILMMIASFASGALYRVAKGETWKEGIVLVVKEAWQGSNLGKIGLAAFLILFAAPMKWNLAAFGLGIYVVNLLEKQNHQSTAPAAAPAAQPQQTAVPVPRPARLPAVPRRRPAQLAQQQVAVPALPQALPATPAAQPQQNAIPVPPPAMLPAVPQPARGQQPAAALNPAFLAQFGDFLQALQQQQVNP